MSASGDSPSATRRSRASEVWPARARPRSPTHARAALDSPSRILSSLRALRRDAGLLLRRHRGGMALLRAARILRAPREHWARKHARARRLADRSVRLAVDPRLGYRWIGAGELPQIAAAVEWARSIHAARAALLPAILAARCGKHRIVFDLLTDVELARRPELLDFALCDELLDAATDYLGELPVLWRIGVGLSVHDPLQRAHAHSQLLHLDGEDVMQLKLMVNVSSVEPDDGPLCLLPADVTQRVLRGAGFDVVRRVAMQRGAGFTTTPRLGDEEAFRHADPSELVRLEGPPGTALLVDTSRCLHFGSRTAPGRQRLLLAVGFQRYHLVNASPFNDFESARARLDPLRRLVIARPRRSPSGSFFPEPSGEDPAPLYARAGP